MRSERLAALELERWPVPPPEVLGVVHDLRRVIRLLSEMMSEADRGLRSK